MRYWFDTEFIENGSTIDLISIGIVADDGREYYAINRDCDFSKASGWVKDNVLSKLPPREPNFEDWSISPRLKEESQKWLFKNKIKLDVAAFLGAEWEESPVPFNWCESLLLDFHQACPKFISKLLSLIPLLKRPKLKYYLHSFKLKPDESKPEIWAYYADYDWVVFCQLFGTMMDLPAGFPMYCRDIKQECDRLGNPELPAQASGKHNALDDARHNKKMWELLDLLHKQNNGFFIRN